ncbi:MAG: UvrD-helicase domain-containing protein, partial [Deltaproteobacteria bacterium]|nr:UvrD-helicase domain-containing protein [Deltaproteobacteria bacterium]
MMAVHHFDLLNSPLAGTNLIEASAGTGKTYTITGLFLRLLLEKRLPVEQILVVTFTEAASGELKDRIRTMLREAVKAFSHSGCEDSFLNALVKKYSDVSTSLHYLRAALRAFDKAAIYTIHGFCLRMLQENAFESATLFDTELVTDQENLKKEIVEDFWRKHLYHESSLFIKYILSKKIGPDTLLSLLSTKVAPPYPKIIPEVPD